MVKKARQLLAIFLICLSLLGYYPSFGNPPIKKSAVLAQVKEQAGEVLSLSFEKPLLLPHPGYLSTKFSSWHPGIDIASGLGMPIHSITTGTVLETGFDFWGLGNYIVIAHQNGFISKYAHLGKIFVKKGDRITSDNMIGEVGLSGRTSGPHTHLEITHNGKSVDPELLLPPLPDMPRN